MATNAANRSGPKRRPAPRKARRPAREPKAASPKRRRGVWIALGGAAGLGFALLTALLVWAQLAGPGPSGARAFDLTSDASSSDTARALAGAGFIRSPTLFRAYFTLVRPGLDLAPGPHLLDATLSPRDLLARLGRVTARPHTRVTLPEGFTLFQVAERLEQSEVCTADGFRSAASNVTTLRPLGIDGGNAEGRLFPATYSFAVDTEATAALRQMVLESRKRLDRVYASRAERLAALRSEFGFGETAILTLASLVEREAHEAGERKLIASVFYNRLRDPKFAPARMLQSDPSAGYGCLVYGATIPSCSGYVGHVTPPMLRDASNPYNTYRHPGLPPGPICNPGVSAIIAVLEPASTEYLYFVAQGGGRHTFSRTLGEHNDAVQRLRAARSGVDASP